MSFKDYITDWRYRRSAGMRMQRLHNLKPPDNPTPRYIRKLVGRLLNPNRAQFALKELGMIGGAAVPALREALDDERFARRAKPERINDVDPLNAVVGLLAKHDPEFVLGFLDKLVDSDVYDAQMISGTHAAGTGRIEALPIVKRCLDHENGYVRCAVLHGVETAVKHGQMQDAFRAAVYDMLLDQCDQEWPISGNDSPRTLIRLDRDRAEADLARANLLSSANPNLRDVLKACRVADIPLPQAPLEQIYRHALGQVQASEDRAYPHDYIAAEAVQLLAAIAPEQEAMRHIDLAGSIDNDRLQEASAHASARRAGIDDPVGFVIARRDEVGYEGLTDPQRVVYCAFLFDAEVCNGGLMQFFGNSSGDHAADTLEALETLGHAPAADALRQAIKAVGPPARQTDRERRLTGFTGRYEKLQEIFGQLEGAYWKHSAQLRAAMIRYAAQHAIEFKS